MTFHVINLDFDGSASTQALLAERIDERVDLRRHQDLVRLYATSGSRSVIRETIREMRKRLPGPWLSFYGSGDYNHVTALLLEDVAAHGLPVTLVLLDNHPDWFNMPLRFHCGTWVCTALRRKWIESAVLIGQDSEDLKGHEFWFSPFGELCDGRVTLYPHSRERVVVPFCWPDRVAGAASSTRGSMGVDIRFDTIAKIGVPGLCTKLAEQLSGKNVYIAIDKDVLLPDFALTDWEQGKLTLDELVSIIDTLRAHCNVVGADVCGERAREPLRGPWKRYDAQRREDGREGDWDSVTRINQATNLRILDAFTDARVPPQKLAST